MQWKGASDRLDWYKTEWKTCVSETLCIKCTEAWALRTAKASSQRAALTTSELTRNTLVCKECLQMAEMKENSGKKKKAFVIHCVKLPKQQLWKPHSTENLVGLNSI